MIGLITLNAKYIHKNLALRWLYQSSLYKEEVKIQEFTTKENIDKIVESIQLQNYTIIGFSIYIWNIDQTLEIIRKIRATNQNVKIIVGGPEVSYDSFDLVDQGIDAICIGEGEQSFWEYVTMIKQNQSYEIEGIYTKKHPNQKYRKTCIKYLESIENPYFLDMDLPDMDKRYLYFETSRGCPYSCEYCLSSCDQEVRLFSLDYVLQMLEKLKDSNVKQVKLLDRTFNIQPHRALQIAKYMNEYCKNQTFQFEIVAETLSEDLLKFFENEADKSRFRFEVGIQSFHAETLQAVGRIQNNARLKEVISRLQQHNVVMHTDLIAGLPYENLGRFQQSFDELFSLHSAEIQLGILKLLKGTKLRKKADLFSFEYEAFAPYTIKKTKWLSSEEMLDIQDCAYAVEKFWNKGYAKYTIQQLILKGYEKSSFLLFMKLGKTLSRLKKPYSLKDLFSVFFQVCSHVEPKVLLGMISMDYFQHFQHRPSLFSEGKLDDEIKHKIIQKAIEEGFDVNHLYRYTLFTYGYDNALCYQMIQYNSAQSYPKRYLIDQELKNIYEVKKK